MTEIAKETNKNQRVPIASSPPKQLQTIQQSQYVDKRYLYIRDGDLSNLVKFRSI